MGRVRRIEPHQIVLEQGTVKTTPETIHIHCAVQGLGSPALKPVFDQHRITLQNLRYGLLPLSAAIIGFVEATRSDEVEKNQLCQPFRYTGVVEDWMRQRLADLENGRRWRNAPDLMQWMEGTRLSMNAGIASRVNEPAIKTALNRIRKNAVGAAKNLQLMAGKAQSY